MADHHQLSRSVSEDGSAVSPRSRSLSASEDGPPAPSTPRGSAKKPLLRQRKSWPNSESLSPRSSAKMASNKYRVLVKTGDKWGAGTDANVFVVLFGDAGESSEQKLNNSKNNFEKGRTDEFVIVCPSVGTLKRIRVGHDNKGGSAGWYLDRVEVEDLAEGRTYQFPCDRWLAQDEDDGAITRDLIAGVGANLVETIEDTEGEMTEIEPFNHGLENSVLVDENMADGIPSPQQQHAIITNIDSECTCTYAMARSWYKKWEEYCCPGGKHHSIDAQTHKQELSPRKQDCPGPVEMDNHNDTNNEYVHEDAWKCFVKWYGIAPSHQLDRKHLYFKDEKMFDICMLSPFSGIVEHVVKKFNRFEEIGYIEYQMRRVFSIGDHKKTRLWISEKAQVPRFRQLLLRFRMLNDCIHRDKVYILALEESSSADVWQTGEPGEPKGDLSKYDELVRGRRPDDYWSTQVVSAVAALREAVSDGAAQMAEGFLQNARSLVREREEALESSASVLESKLEEVTAKDKFLDDKARQLARQEEIHRQDRSKLETERKEFEAREAKFDEELKHMETMHKIQETKIKLDIGGCTYTTSISTLRRDSDSMLAAMFSGRHELQKEADGSYFIDRDGIHFRHILNFLRDGHCDRGTLPSDSVLLKELLREARYFQLGGLIKYLEEVVGSNGH